MRAVLLIASFIAATGATICTRAVWGFWFLRPSIHQAAWNVSGVDAFTGVTCDRSPRGWSCTPTKEPVVAEDVATCARDSYDCLTERLVVALNERQLIRDGLPQPSASDVRRLASALSSPGLVTPAEAGYTGDRVLGGILVVGTTPDHERVLLAGLRGPEISNDHHPYYELLLDGHNGGLLQSRHFYYDVAGLEGVEPFWWIGVFTFIAAPLVLALGLARRALMVRRARAIM